MTSTDKPVSRREFARRAALGAASATLLPVHELVPMTAAPTSALPAQTPSAAPNLTAQSQAEAESRYQAIVRQYPNGFSDAQKADLKRLCLFVQPSLDHIRAYTISNSDLPALYLKPLVDRDKKPAIKPAAPGAAKSAAPTTKLTTPAPGKP